METLEIHQMVMVEQVQRHQLTQHLLLLQVEVVEQLMPLMQQELVVQVGVEMVALIQDKVLQELQTLEVVVEDQVEVHRQMVVKQVDQV